MDKTILVVDDEKPIADILQFNLIKEGDCLLLVCVERFDYLLRDVANVVYDQLAY